MTDADIAAAVAAEEPGMVSLLADLVAAPTVLGNEEPGQAVMRRAFSGLGLAPADVPLEPGELELSLNATRPALYAEYPHPIHLNVGMIRGGDWPSTVAGECLTNFRLACFPGEPVAELRAQVEATVAVVAATLPHSVEVLYDGFQCEGYELGVDAPLVGALGDAVERVRGTRPPLFASTATTDARTFQLYAGTPAICFGPTAENEHGVDERVHLPSVVETAQAIALFIADWCGVKQAT